MAQQQLSTREITEYDDSGELARTYIVSGPVIGSAAVDDGDKKKGKRDDGGSENQEKSSGSGRRIDVIKPQHTINYVQLVIDVFLPTGFPHCVTEDYVPYQIFDSLQAFSSSIAAMLTSRAVLQGVGVGDSSANPTTALLLSVVHDSAGRLATILFAHRLGTALEPECKMYRLAADIFNDTAMVLDCLSPAFPKPVRIAVLSFSSCLRALCGVCAGSAKASLSAHFAKRGNLGEVNAKDSSQETVISLLGMLTGSFVVAQITSPVATWCTLIFLLSLHLGTNYAAVRSVSMQLLNRQRANILFSNVFQDGVVLSPIEVSARERIFERDGVLRWMDGTVLGKCRIGVSLEELLGRLGSKHKQSGSVAMHAIDLSDLLSVFQAEAYILWPASPAYEALIVLKAGCGPIDQLRAWAHALLLAKRAQRRRRDGDTVGKPDDAAVGAAAQHRHHGLIAELTETLSEVRTMFDKYGDAMRSKGWDLEAAALETQAGMRLHMS